METIKKMENRMEHKHKIALAVLAALSTLPMQSQAAQLLPVNSNKAIKDTYIVVFNTPSILNLQDTSALANFSTQQANILANDYNISVVKNFGNALNGVLIKANAKQIAELQDDPKIKYIEQDQMMSISPIMSASSDQGSPTWGLDRIDQRDLPFDNNYHYDYDGTGVTAYIIDTGYSIAIMNLVDEPPVDMTLSITTQIPQTVMAMVLMLRAQSVVPAMGLQKMSILLGYGYSVVVVQAVTLE